MLRTQPLDRRGRATRTIAGAVIASALVAATPPLARVSGVTYTMRSSTVPSGEGRLADAMEAQRASWLGTVRAASGRGRIDIVDGAQRPMFEKGDYMLFDADGSVIVHPATKTFVTLPTDMSARATRIMEASGVTMVIDKLTASLDTLGAKDTILGQSTHHYRVNASYTLKMQMSMDLGGYEPPTFESTTNIEYWYPDGTILPINPLMRSPTGERGPATGSTKELTEKLRALMSALPNDRSPVRVVTSTRTSGGPGMSGRTDHTVEVLDMKVADVDVTQLVLPRDFTESPMAGFESLPGGAPMSKDGGAKWRVEPHP